MVHRYVHSYTSQTKRVESEVELYSTEWSANPRRIALSAKRHSPVFFKLVSPGLLWHNTYYPSKLWYASTWCLPPPHREAATPGGVLICWLYIWCQINMNTNPQCTRNACIALINACTQIRIVNRWAGLHYISLVCWSSISRLGIGPLL